MKIQGGTGIPPPRIDRQIWNKCASLVTQMAVRHRRFAHVMPALHLQGFFMSEPSPSSGRFVQLVSSFYRLNGSDVPYFDFSPEEATAFEVRVGDVVLSVGYDPFSAGGPDLFVYCVFGEIAPHQDQAVLGRLLELNLPLSRGRNATFCFDRKTREVACCLRRNLSQLNAQALSDDVSEMARHARQWQQDPMMPGLEMAQGGNATSVDVPWDFMSLKG